MVVAFENLTKTALSQPVGDFKPVSQMLSLIGDILVFVVIKSVVVHTIRSIWWTFLGFSICDVHPIDYFVLKDLSLLNFHQILGVVDDHSPWIHWELEFFLTINERPVSCLLDDG